MNAIEALERFVRDSASCTESDTGYYLELLAEPYGEPYVQGDNVTCCWQCAVRVRRWFLRWYERQPPDGWTAERVRVDRRHNRGSGLVYIGQESESDSSRVCSLCGLLLNVALTQAGACNELEHFWTCHASSSESDRFESCNHFEIERVFQAFGGAPDFPFCPASERGRLEHLLFRLAWWMVCGLRES